MLVLHHRINIFDATGEILIMSEELELLKDVASRLNKERIEYMMTGSMAMALYSTPRMTRDIDIIIQVSLADVDRIVDIFTRDFYIDAESVRQAIKYKSVFNIIHNDSVIKIDFIIRKDEKYRIEEFSRKQEFTIEGIPIWVVSVEDLILSKLIWAKLSESELQYRDVHQMLKVIQSIDDNYLQKWAKSLDVEDLLRKVKDHARHLT